MSYRVPADRPPIVLLHSSMSSKSQWRELIESLKNRYRLIAIDLLGYGESAMPSSCEAYSLDDEVRRVESVLARELQPGEQFHLIGHSFGGVVALQLAAQSQRVRSLSLFEPIVFHLLPAGDPDLEVVEEGWREIADRLSAGDAYGAAAWFVGYWSGAGAFAQLRAERQSLLAAQVPKILIELRAVADQSRNIAAYRRIAAPTCLVAGLWSPEPAHRLTSMLADVLPHASCFEVAAGHMAPITHPELVNPILEKFIRAVDASEYHERPSLIPQFSEMTAAVRGNGWSRAISISVATALAIALSGLVGALPPSEHAAPNAVYPLEESAWHEAPPGVLQGGKFAVISGDPHEAAPFVMRVRLPPGHILPPYRGHRAAQMIVLVGDLTMGVGASEAAATRTLTAGSYASLTADVIHMHTKNGAIVQLFGIGPFEMRST